MHDVVDGKRALLEYDERFDLNKTDILSQLILFETQNKTGLKLL